MRERKKSLKNFRDLSKYDWRLPCPKYFKMGKSSPGKTQSICFFVFTHLLELEKVKRDARFHFREHVCRRASRSPAKCMLHRWASNISICTREQLCVFFREARFFRGGPNEVTKPESKWHPPMWCSLTPWFQKYQYLRGSSKELRAPATWSLCSKTSLRALHRPSQKLKRFFSSPKSVKILHGTLCKYSPTL